MIDVGEYIRTKNGLIFKARKIETSKIDIYWVNDEIYLLKEDIKSHSKNIIDLIEIGDFVNGFKIYNMEYITYNNHIDLVFTIFKTPIDFTSPYKVIVTWQEKDIKSILTHEMYEQNCYKVGEY